MPSNMLHSQNRYKRAAPYGIDHILLMNKSSQTNPNPRDQQDLQHLPQMEGSSCVDHHLILFNNRSEEEDDHSRNSNDSSSDLMEDASSSSSSSSLSNGPLYELSELMSHLPIKRGLSKYYEGKSQSFTSLERVKSKEELVKKVNPYNKKSSYKKSKSYNHTNKYSYSPKATIAKKVSRGVTLLSSSMMSNRSTLLGSFRPPIPIQKCSHLA